MEKDQTELVAQINQLLKDNELGHLKFLKMELMPVEDEFMTRDNVSKKLPDGCCIKYINGRATLKCPC